MSRGARATASAGPLFSIVTPVYDPDVSVLDSTIASVAAQSYDNWELILVDDCSSNPAVRDKLREWAARDARVRVIERPTNGHIVRASNDGIAAARGDFIAFLDHDDLLRPLALQRNAQAIADDEEVDYLYSDEEVVDMDGNVKHVFRKPVWSPERLRGQNYCNHFSVYRASLVREVGGLREGFEGSQDHDLVLRAGEKARSVKRIPEVLYSWRMAPGSTATDPHAKPYVFDAGRRAIQEHLDRVGVDATASVGGIGRYVLERRLPAERRVSVIIPTIGSSGVVWGRRRVFVVDAVKSVLACTDHRNLEIVVVYDAPTPPEVLAQLREVAGRKLVLVPFREKFNYSRKMNFGVLASSGDRVVLLNDDVEVRDKDWIVELVAPLEEESVGQTGAFLFFASDTYQHVGIACRHGVLMHPFTLMADGEQGPFGVLGVSREVAGVTGACAAMRRETFLSVGGFSESLPENYNDVDLSNKVRHAGLRVVVMPRCRLFHFETQTRTSAVEEWEKRAIRARWSAPSRDPFTNDFWNEPEGPRERDAAAARRRRVVARSGS